MDEKDQKSKGLKQARLPFSIISSKPSVENSNASSLPKKRKSEDCERNEKAKCLRTDSTLRSVNENNNVEIENVPTLANSVTVPVSEKSKECLRTFLQQSPPKQTIKKDQTQEITLSDSDKDINASEHEQATGDDATDHNVSVVSQDMSCALDTSLENGCETPDAKKPKLMTPKVPPKSSSKKAKLSDEKLKARKEMLEKAKMEKEEERLRIKKEKEEERLNLKKQKEKEKLLLKQQKEEEKLKQKQERDAARLKKEEEKKEKKEKEEQEKKLAKEQLIQEKLEEKQRKLDEKKKEEEEMEKKNAKSKEAFAKFFVKSQPSPKDKLKEIAEPVNFLFKPFEIKKNMSVAPSVRKEAAKRFNREELEELFKSQTSTELYTDLLKKKTCHPVKLNKKKKSQLSQSNEVVVISKEMTKISDMLHHPKLFQFCENVRPPYFGTWRKKSKVISGRRPFQKDEVHFDYDVDSEEDWEEGGDGESLQNTDNEKESEDDYDIDNEFFVPHGYLSSDEEAKGDEAEMLDPEIHKARLKMREKEFQEDRSKKCLPMKPLVVYRKDLENFRLNFTAVFIGVMPIETTFSIQVPDPCKLENSPQSGVMSSQEGSSKKQPQIKAVTEKAMPHLIRLLHGNPNSRSTVIKEFRAYWEQFCSNNENEVVDSRNTREAPVVPEVNPALDAKQLQDTSPKTSTISKRQLEKKLSQIASWMKCPDPCFNKLCWWVHPEIREKYGLSDLQIPNNWQYITISKPAVELEPEKPSPALPSIMKFAQKCTPTAFLPPKEEDETEKAIKKEPKKPAVEPAPDKPSPALPSIMKFAQKCTPTAFLLPKEEDEKEKKKEVTKKPRRIDLVHLFKNIKPKIEVESDVCSDESIVCLENIDKTDDDIIDIPVTPESCKGTPSVRRFLKLDSPLSTEQKLDSVEKSDEKLV